ncbi:AAA domain-containing protein [Bacillus sp. FJAT-47783]|uniref:AAA domain-containing protein n=1 Tax=Bacillus sp. FJAT-47783 TaxID=2922712 RepID=UPI001FADE76E|nr:AAA domain-containing protein [Bacillus sp. FJAT-47783]
MTSTLTYIQQWQKAIQAEIHHLKKYGSTKYHLTNGRLISSSPSFTYYFDTTLKLRVPVGSNIKLEWGHLTESGRILSSEGNGVILSFERSFGDLIHEAFLFHDPWELLDELCSRLDEMKKSKRKRARIKKVMEPNMPPKHPTDRMKSNVHELILRSKYNPITYVWGPPGTGKTYTLARVAANKYIQKKQVLILAHSNQAVDVLMNEIASFLKKKDRLKEGDILRYGTQTSDTLQSCHLLTTTQLLEKHHPNLFEKKARLMEERRLLKQDLTRSFSKRDSDRLLELEKQITYVLEKVHQKDIQFAKDAKVIGTTLAKAASDPIIYEKDFDVIIVDEASMAYIPQAAFAATLGKRSIICGDFKQLPPIAQARHPLVTEWLKDDIFHKSGVADSVKKGELHPHLFLLKEQRRMHPAISSFTNHYIYESLVGDHPSVSTSREEIVQRAPFSHQASILLDTSFTGEYGLSEKHSNSRMNLWHLMLSFQLLHEAYLDGARSIGYVTPYRAQAMLMEKLLSDLYEQERQTADIISATVHRFQGSERDVMIFDTVDSHPFDRAGMLLTGRDSERLINVAITRTKGKFIHLSNIHFMRENVFRNKTIRQLVEHQVENEQAVYPSKIGTWIKNQHSKLQWMHAKKLEKVFQDIRQAKSSILISVPTYSFIPDEWVQVLNERKAQVQLTMMSSSAPHKSLSFNHYITYELPFPFVIIDNRFLWLGLPLFVTEKLRPPYVAARLDSKLFVEHFLLQLPNE